MKQDTLKHQAGEAYHAALRTASQQLQAKIAQDERNRKLCICLEIILDNGDCPIHGKGFGGGSHERTT